MDNLKRKIKYSKIGDFKEPDYNPRRLILIKGSNYSIELNF